jgi:hypothetical protein
MADRELNRRRLFWAATVAAVVALISGGVVAYLTYASTSGPDGAVKGYFAALARGDAPAALAFGDVPPGNHEFLTSKMLRAQREVAPLRHVDIIAIERSGGTAKVTVQYDLDFESGKQQIADNVRVVRHDGSWRLVRSAATTRLTLRQAGERATIMGGRVPDGPVLMFPGAVPIEFDSQYLRLANTTNSVPLSAAAQTSMTVEISPAGQVATDNAIVAALTACLSGTAHADPRCPVPTSQAVPGSLRATVSAADVRNAATVSLASSAQGVLNIGGKIKLTGRYNTLDFDNQPVVKRGSISVPLSAVAYAVEPIKIDWGGAQP